MKYTASSPIDYIQQLPEDRKAPITRLHQTILDHLPKGFESTLGYGMLAYVVPLSTYPEGYHCKADTPLPFINLASQKNFIALYHMGLYADKDLLNWFTEAYPKHSPYKLDMGKSCIRFKKLEGIPYDLIAELCRKITVDEWIQRYENALKK